MAAHYVTACSLISGQALMLVGADMLQLAIVFALRGKRFKLIK
jgi:hypothetical protein